MKYITLKIKYASSRNHVYVTLRKIKFCLEKICLHEFIKFKLIRIEKSFMFLSATFIMHLKDETGD